jgi:hypothetical protein
MLFSAGRGNVVASNVLQNGGAWGITNRGTDGTVIDGKRVNHHRGFTLAKPDWPGVGVGTGIDVSSSTDVVVTKQQGSQQQHLRHRVGQGRVQHLQGQPVRDVIARWAVPVTLRTLAMRGAWSARGVAPMRPPSPSHFTSFKFNCTVRCHAPLRRPPAVERGVMRRRPLR